MKFHYPCQYRQEGRSRSGVFSVGTEITGEGGGDWVLPMGRAGTLNFMRFWICGKGVITLVPVSKSSMRSCQSLILRS